MPTRTLASHVRLAFLVEDHPRGPNQTASSHQDFSSRLCEESKDSVEDTFLFLRDDAGGRVLLEGTVSFLLAHLERKGSPSVRSTPEWMMGMESLPVVVEAAKPKPACPLVHSPVDSEGGKAARQR